jgi:hypothetical protein
MFPVDAHKRALSCAVVLLLVVGIMTGTAAAQEKSAVVVIDSGTEDLFIESLVRTNAETELAKKGYHIVAGAEVGGETPKRLLACAGDLACSSQVMQNISATYVVFISLRSNENSGSTNFKIVIRNYEVATGRVLARTMRRCPECKEEVDLAAFTAQLIVDLTSEKDVETTEFVVEPLTSDGPADPDPADPPEPVTGPIPVPVTVPSPGPPVAGQVDVQPSRAPLLTYVGMGVGTVAVAVGTYMVLIDGPVIENDLRKPDANDTLVPGFLTLGAGVAAIGLSAWIWSRRRADNSALTSLAPALVPSDEGASLVWSGGF